MRRICGALIALAALVQLLIGQPPRAAGGDAETDDDRQRFLAAEAALERSDMEEFEALSGTLRNYPLYPYLRYRRVASDPRALDSRAVAGYLRAYADTPLADRLRRIWLKQLAKKERWAEFSRVYLGDGSTRDLCHSLHGLLQQGQHEVVFERVDSLWLRGQSLPSACDPVLEAWKGAGRLSTDLLWQRIALAMAAGELGLARYLGQSLPAAQGDWLDFWQVLYRNPRLALDADWLALAHHPYREQMLTQALARLAHREPESVAAVWDRFGAGQSVADSQAQQVNAALGFALCAKGESSGLDYLGRIRAREDNLPLQERRLRVALRLGYWDGVADWILAMPDGQRKTDHWLYWQARAEDLRGNRKQARILFEVAAGERSLWGFLAAERLGKPYRLDSAATPADPARIARIEQHPALTRMELLQALGRGLEVRREWHHLTADMDPEDLMAAAVLAQRRGWPQRAIFTLAASGYWDDLALRFPVLYRDQVRRQAVATGLDEPWIYAVLRQESAFDPSALSPAGAAGLMQLMPGTAREVAQSLALPRPTRDALFDPALNISLGSAYLAQMKQRFEGHPALATAAYNAGPHRVARWLPESGIDAEVWIATIALRETRDYVRRVLAYRLIYAHRLGQPIAPLLEVLRAVAAPLPRPAAPRSETGANTGT